MFELGIDSVFKVLAHPCLRTPEIKTEMRFRKLLLLRELKQTPDTQ